MYANHPLVLDRLPTKASLPQRLHIPAGRAGPSQADMRKPAALLPPVRQVLVTFGVLQHVQAGRADALASSTDQLAPGT